MEQRLKERLTGAGVLMLVTVIFVPMILDNAALDPVADDESRDASGSAHQSRIIPVQNIPPAANVSAIEVPSAGINDNDERSPGSSSLIPAGQADTPTPPDKMMDEGVASTTPVKSESISGGQENPVAEPPPMYKKPVTGNGLDGWVVQLGSFSGERNAESLVRDLLAQGYPAYIEEISNQSGPIYRVRVGPEINKADAEQAIKSLAAKFGLKGILVQYP